MSQGQSRLSKKELLALSDDDFFVYAERELQEVKKEYHRIEKDIQHILDIAQTKKILRDILHNY